MHQNNRQHFLLYNFVKNEAESQAVLAVSYVRNVRGRAMLPDSTVLIVNEAPSVMRKNMHVFSSYLLFLF